MIGVLRNVRMASQPLFTSRSGVITNPRATPPVIAAASTTGTPKRTLTGKATAARVTVANLWIIPLDMESLIGGLSRLLGFVTRLSRLSRLSGLLVKLP